MQKNSKTDRQFHIRRTDRRLAYQGEIVDLYQDTVILPDGSSAEWDFVHHKRLRGASIVPVLKDGRILMVRQYRPANDLTMLEIPAGTIDRPGESTEAAARRELLEETGCTCGRIHRMITIMPAAAWCDMAIDIYLAEDVERTDGQHLDRAEEIEIVPCTLEYLMKEIYAGRMIDAKSIAGIMSYAAGRGIAD